MSAAASGVSDMSSVPESATEQQQQRQDKQEQKKHHEQQQQRQPKSPQEEETVPLFPSVRLLMAGIVFLGTATLYMMRANLGFAIVCMVPSLPGGNGTNFSEGAALANPSDPWLLQWDRVEQGRVLSSYYVGYTLSQLLAGLLALRISGRSLVAGAMVASAVSTALLPPAASVTLWLAVVLREVTGIAAGVILPSLMQMMSFWTPPLERSKLIGFSLAGAHAGTVAAVLLSSALCASVGWQYIFYLCGGVGLLWTVLWLTLVADSPHNHPFVSRAEKRHIQHSLLGQLHEQRETSAKVPWLKMLKSRPVWATVIATSAYDWGGVTFMTLLPTYFKEVLHLSLGANALYSCLPYVGYAVVQLLAGWLADWLQASGQLGTVGTRRLMTCASMLTPAAVLLVLGFAVGASQWRLVVALLTVGISMKGAAFSGLYANLLDIAPRYAGLLFAVCNVAGAVSGVLAPNVAAGVRWASRRHEPQVQWQRVFLLTAGVYSLGSAAYAAMASGQMQAWAALP